MPDTCSTVYDSALGLLLSRVIYSRGKLANVMDSPLSAQFMFARRSSQQRPGTRLLPRTAHPPHPRPAFGFVPARLRHQCLMMPAQLPKSPAARPGRRERTMISRSYPPKVHAASLFSLQVWAFSELRDLIPPLGQRARAARLLFLGLVAVLAVLMALSYPVGAFFR